MAKTGRKGAASRRFAAALVLLTLTLGMALVSVAWTPYPLADTSGGRLEAPSAAHLLGTDKLGRDLASFVMAGTRIAYLVGLSSTLIACALGVSLGLAAAWLPAWADHALSSFLDILIAFPTLLLAMLLGATQGRSTATAVLSIGIALSAVVARLTRILAKQVMSRPFFLASRCSGTGALAATGIHILPNIWPTLSVNVAVLFGGAILAEASLSYLGLGVPPPNASLGRLMQDAQSTVLVSPLGALAPGLVIVAIVSGANLLADAIRDRWGIDGGLSQ